MKKSFRLSAAVLVLFFAVPVFSLENGLDSSAAAFVQGTTAFRSGEWMSAVFMLRRAVSYPENFNPETWYMLIAAEMYAGEYKSAFQDAETYLSAFPDSLYESYVMYHKGRALFCLGEYERSVLLLSDFCHLYPEHEMYASALFWIAESFYSGYNYDDAEILYSRVVNEFPSDSKASAAQYRIETIAQIRREEKLLYLLKETGEEYLAAKEEYERQLKLSGAENASDIRRRIMDLQMRNSELEKKVSDLELERLSLQRELESEKAANSNIKAQSDEMLNSLKIKAKSIEELLQKKTN